MFYFKGYIPYLVISEFCDTNEHYFKSKSHMTPNTYDSRTHKLEIYLSYNVRGKHIK